MKKRMLFGIASALAVSAMTAYGAGFAKTNTYNGEFTDVATEQWYASSVASAYELGFMKGSSATIFGPEGNMTVAEAITIASRVNDAYYSKGTTFDQSGTNWYDCYVKYAVENGIISQNQFDNYDRNITRAEMAKVFAKAVPADWLKAQNNVTEIPDVPETNSYYEELKLLYNAGVIMGNDEFGTFKPNNNIIRAEAAAIIGRVALPENRLTKTLVDANYDDAYYMIDSGSASGMWGNSTQYDTPWQYDNRNRTNVISNSADATLTDNYTDGKVEVWRDTDTVESGLVGFDFRGNLINCQSGAYFKLTDDSKNEVVALTVKDGKFFLNGVDTGVVTASTATFSVGMRIDLDKRNVLLSLYDKVVGTFDVAKGSISRIYAGIDEPGTGTLSISKFYLYKDYVVNEAFLEEEGSELIRWNVTGKASVSTMGSHGQKYINSAKLEGNTSAKYNFNKLSGNIVYEAYMLFPEDNDAGFISLDSGSTSVAKLVINNDGVFKADGTKLRHHTNNVWQTLRIELDTVNNTATYKVNGKKVYEGEADAYLNTVDGITAGSTSGSVYLDDVRVYMTHEYDDYCPEPVPVNNDGYDVILNMCSLWHEGQHQGWGAVSAYPDIEPALGYYDEGIIEVADWEIKFMVENGIDVQHLCWYAPSSDVKEPIKKSNMNDALHNGFFNAKYSDMMKFTFMWENSGVNCKGLEQFKKYIWSYWMEYYFLDDRFYTIDNKLVFTVWSYTNFAKAFGNGADGAREAVKWMNEDAKAHGFDGVMIFFADGHATEASAFENMANNGGTAAYAYHWQQDGIYADTTIARLNRNAGHNKIHIIPTVSVGFNNIGWSGVRKKLASLSDHKKVLEHIKNEYLPKYNGWKSKTLIVSTWNEYGEGTYVMPCAGLHGFGYLENVAEVISGDTEHKNNIYPTEQQKARLGHLYPDTKTSIKRLDNEKNEEIPTRVVASFSGEDFAINMNTDSIEYVDGVAVGVTTKSDPAFGIKKDVLEAKGDINLEDVVALRITASGTNVGDRIYFTTKAATGVSESKSFAFNMKPSDELAEYIIYTGTNANWTGLFNSFRLDIIKGPGTFKLKSIEFLGYEEDKLPYSLTVNTTEYKPYFAPIMRNGELYVAADAVEGFFSLHNFYYEWSRKTGVLYILTRTNHEFTFTVGSDKAIVDGKETALKEPFTLRDGLPELPMFFIYDKAEMIYKVEGNSVTVSTASKEYEDIVLNRVAYAYEFDVPGDLEGLHPSGTAANVKDGVLTGDAIERTNPQYDPMFTISNLKVNTLECNKIVIGMKHKFYDADNNKNHIKIYFTTDTDGALSESKAVACDIEGNSSKDFVEYVFDFSENKHWSGNITKIRVDPMDCGGSFEIDYIRFVIDKSLIEQAQKAESERLEAIKKDEEERLAKGIIVANGDAENNYLDKTFYGAGDSVSRVKDGENYVWKITAPANKAWTYIRQNVTYVPGATYKVQADIKVLGTANDPNAGGLICCNVVYAGADGKTDHVVVQQKIEAGKWTSTEFEFTVEPTSKERGKDQFTFYSNPVGDLGLSFFVDNIVVTKISTGETVNPEELIIYQSLAEFENPDNMESFTPNGVTVTVEDGVLKASATGKDPVFVKGGLGVSSGASKKIVVRMKHSLADGASKANLQVFFVTNADSNFDEAKSKKVVVNGNSSEDFVEYVIDFSNNSRWNGNITAIRIDPIDCGGSFEIDYIRFVK